MVQYSKKGGGVDFGSGVRSVERALRLLEQLSVLGGANLSELARDTKLSLSTCHRLLTTLQGHGFVQYERKCAQWMIGHRTLAVGAAFARARDLVGLACHIMGRAARASGEIVNLGAISGHEIMFLHRIDLHAPRSTGCSPAGSIPAHCSSIGKAILAGLPEHDVRDLIGALPLTSCTEKSITRPKQLLADLRHCGKRGFAIDDEENTVGLRCVAAPIFDEFRRPIAAVSIAAAAERLGGEQIAVFGGIVAAAARDITRACGGSGPPNC
jgi:IclR family transcriptional regulator, acetate operon repressor